jgi:transporter family-2 protein
VALLDMHIVAAVHVAWTGAPRSMPVEAWLYAGGLFGVVYIFLAALIVPRMGVLLFGFATVTGQLTTSFILDVLSWLDATRGSDSQEATGGRVRSSKLGVLSILC